MHVLSKFGIGIGVLVLIIIVGASVMMVSVSPAESSLRELIRDSNLPEINKQLRLGQIDTCKDEAALASAMANAPGIYDTIVEKCIDGLTESIKRHNAGTP